MTTSISPVRDLGKILWISAGWVAMAIGIIALALPILPTAPFIILAAYCFSRGSRKLHHWIRTRKYFGPIVLEWEQHQVIRLRVKVIATVLTIFSFVTSMIFLQVPWSIKLIIAAIIMVALCYIWTRPSHVGGKRLRGKSTATGGGD
jgi:uncharacterized membrane protein YbaN (DUF454 family)